MNFENTFKVLRVPHVSEKSSGLVESHNVIVMKVLKTAKKKDIAYAVNTLFEVKVKKINSLIVKGKTKRQGKNIGCRKDWKKAYITLQDGYKVDLNTK